MGPIEARGQSPLPPDRPGPTGERRPLCGVQCSGMSSPTPTPNTEHQTPRLGRALKQGLRGAYDYMGTVLVASALWVGLAALLGAGGTGLFGLVVRSRSAGVALLALLGGLGAGLIGTGPVTAALFEHTRRLLAHEDPDWWELPVAVARLWRRGLALAGLQVTVSLVLAVDALFFLRQEAALLRGIGLAFIYPILIWWSASLLQWPLAAELSAEPLRQVVKKSFLLLLDNLSYVSALTLLVLALTALCLAWPIGWIGLTLAWAGTLAFVQTAALRELLPQYGLLPPPDDESSLS
jgi:uncharacterized membrane protein YesL